MKFLKKLIRLKIFIIILVPVIIIVLLAAFWYAITKGSLLQISDTVKSITSDESGNVRASITINQENRNYEIADNLTEEVDKLLKENNIDKEAIGLGNDLSVLKKFYQAEVITSFPDLRQREEIGTPVPDGEIQGTVQIYRKYTDDTGELLEYMPFEEYKQEAAKFGIFLQDDLFDTEESELEDTFEQNEEQAVYTTREETEAAYNEFKRYFTLDKDFNIMVATLNSEETTITYSNYAKEEGNTDSYVYNFEVVVKRVNYQTAIDQYTMPFEFLLSLLLVTQNADFCETIVDDLVQDSKIVIEAQDAMTGTVKTKTYDYKAEFQFSKYVEYETYSMDPYADYSGDVVSTGFQNLDGTATKQKDMNNPYRKEVVSTGTNTLVLCATEVHSWIADYQCEFEELENTDSQEQTNTQPDDGDFSQISSDYHHYLDTLNPDLPEHSRVTSTRTEIYEKQTEKEEKITTETIATDYSKVQTKANLKEENFLSLLRIDPSLGKYNKEDRLSNTKLIRYEAGESGKTSPEDNLLDGKYILFDLLASTEKTQSFETLMRYLLYIYTGNDYGVTDLGFEMFEEQEFIVVQEYSQASTGSVLVEYINSWENATAQNYIDGNSSYNKNVARYITEDKTQYVCYTDGSGRRNYGAGVCHYANGEYRHVSLYAELGLDITQTEYNRVGISTIDVEIVNAVMQKIMEANETSIRKKLDKAGITLSQNQIDALAAVMYQYGNIGNFVSAYQKYGDTEAFRSAFTVNGKKPFLTGVESNGRASANWTLFHEGKYMSSTGKELVASAGGGTVSAESGTGYTHTFDSNGRTFKGYKQYIYYQVYGESSVRARWLSSSGCGLTSAAIVISGYKDGFTPVYLYDNYRAVEGSVNIPKYLTDAGLHYEKRGIVTEDNMASWLSTGGQIIVCLYGNSRIFGESWAGSSGHYITFLGVRQNGGHYEVYVSNPGANDTHKNGWYELSEFIPHIYSDHTYYVSQ